MKLLSAVDLLYLLLASRALYSMRQFFSSSPELEVGVLIPFKGSCYLKVRDLPSNMPANHEVFFIHEEYYCSAHSCLLRVVG